MSNWGEYRRNYESIWRNKEGKVGKRKGGENER